MLTIACILIGVLTALFVWGIVLAFLQSLADDLDAACGDERLACGKSVQTLNPPFSEIEPHLAKHPLRRPTAPPSWWFEDGEECPFVCDFCGAPQPKCPPSTGERRVPV